jgi:hypothetical protein
VADGVAVDGTFEGDAPAVGGIGAGVGRLLGRCPLGGEDEKENKDKYWAHWGPFGIVRRVPIGDNKARENVENFCDFSPLSIREKKFQARTFP